MFDPNGQIEILTGAALLNYRAFLFRQNGRRYDRDSNGNLIGRSEEGELVARIVRYPKNLTKDQLKMLAPMWPDIIHFEETSLKRHNVKFEIQFKDLEFHSIEIGNFSLSIEKNKLISLLVAVNLGLAAVPQAQSALEAIPGIEAAWPNAVSEISKIQEMGKKLLNDTLFKDLPAKKVTKRQYQDIDPNIIVQELFWDRDNKSEVTESI